MFSGFMANSWIVATIIAVTAGCVGFFVVIRGSSFAAHAIALGAFPGAALASLLGFNQIYGLIGFAGLGAAGISQLGRFARRDVATALALVALLGLGALFLSLTTEYAQAVYALLFGELLGIDPAAIVPLACICGLCLVALALLFRPLLLSGAAPALAEAGGISNRRIELCFLAILALFTAAALPVVGALLVFSLTIAPAAAARSLSRRPAVAMPRAAGIALFMAWAALALSYATDWPVGFFVGTLGAAIYGAARAAAR